MIYNIKLISWVPSSVCFDALYICWFKGMESVERSHYQPVVGDTIFLCFKIPASPATTRVPMHPWATFSAAAEHGRIYKQLPSCYSFFLSPTYFTRPRLVDPTRCITPIPPPHHLFTPMIRRFPATLFTAARTYRFSPGTRVPTK